MNVAQRRLSSRSPIDESEVPYLDALGAELRQLREAAGLSRSELAPAAKLSEHQLTHIEWGTRRTRRSTLARIASVLDEDNAEDLTERLVAVAGPGLAAESQYSDRVERRRERRFKKQAKAATGEFEASLPLARTLVAAAVAHYRATGRWPSWLEAKQ